MAFYSSEKTGTSSPESFYVVSLECFGNSPRTHDVLHVAATFTVSPSALLRLLRSSCSTFLCASNLLVYPNVLFVFSCYRAVLLFTSVPSRIQQIRLRPGGGCYTCRSFAYPEEAYFVSAGSSSENCPGWDLIRTCQPWSKQQGTHTAAKYFLPP